MNKTFLYHASVLFCGGVLGTLGLAGLSSGSVTVVSVLLSVGGIGMVLATLHEAVLSSDPSETVPDDRAVWVTVGMAMLGAVGLLWTVAL